MRVAALQSAEWLNRPETQAIFAALDGHKRRTRAVGGVVRDSILERLRDSTDIDLATELLPADVIARASAAGIATYPTGIDHGTVTLKLGDTLAEVTTLRQDIETDGRHAVVAFGTDWRMDASRRDFTLNALYCADDGTLYDPLAGIEDALNGRVRFIGDASQRIAEDGLRVYRFFRFSASHGGQQYDPDGLAASRDAVHRLDHLSAERVGSELMRMLALPAVAGTLAVMSEIGLLEASEPVLRQLLAYEAIGGRAPLGRLAILASGQPETVQERWRLSKDVVKGARAIALSADLLVRDKIGEAAYRYGEAAVDGLAVAAASDRWSRDHLAEAAREMARLRIPELPVSGHDLTGLGLAPGPALGQQLARLEEAWIESDFTLARDDLLALVER
ncbi:CCA tRNA nucleotidyltransferase [Devosia sp. SL43]|uniref:CCA tRNA nucleotidyltransferase n=1 Tax=Devosia sp. SL43 TaxID=2806348 RepID=UPI001F336F6C|nr:CCA tRNA nucleotidyltransferase [Devosia sp. SL43]UJW87027.1 CCA tRNA nucleotidyltransferase [Devosia sp. SL43]